MMNILAFDLGASSGKLYLARYDGNRLSLETVCRVENGPVSMGDGLYWDIPGIWRALLPGIREAVDITGDEITSIGFDSFCNDFGLIAANGDLISQIRCYRDPRTARHQAEMDAVMDPYALYQVNGNQRGLFNTLPQLFAMQKEGQEGLLDECRHALFVSDLFAYLLTGNMVTEYTTASVTQMFSYSDMDWSEEVLRRFGIRKQLFAPLVMPGDSIGVTTAAVNERLGTKGIPVTAVCQHDTASAFLGAAAEEGGAIISAGTWSVVGMEMPHPVIREYGFRNNLANEGSCPGHHRILKNTMGTWILQEIAAELRERGEKYSFAELDEKAEAYVGSNCIVDVDDPLFYSPGNMLAKVADHCSRNGIPQPESIGETVYAVQAGLACRYRAAIEELETLTGKELTRIHLVGGGSQSDLACRLTADICGLPVTAGPVDATALGNVLVQLAAAGAFASLEEGQKQIRKDFPLKEYKPAQDRTAWEEKYQRFKKERSGK